jgi:hypothetical protein
MQMIISLLSCDSALHRIMCRLRYIWVDEID